MNLRQSLSALILVILTLGSAVVAQQKQLTIDDLYDPVKVGFQEPPQRAVGPDGKMEQRYFLFDTRRRGEGNGGHLYGTSLPPEQKDQLIEYLKTL